ncbi:hypothetical protein BU26DRAFT_399624, partial [Trematosphaeria pertusa]
NQRESPLLRLPAELRNKIYSYVLGGRLWELKDTLTAGSREKNSMSLLRVCRQINAETASLPFELGTFSFESLSALMQWSQRMPPKQRDAVRSVRTAHCSSWD